MNNEQRPLRFGIIGPGYIARKFCEAARMAEGAQVVAAASRTRERAESFAKEFSLEACASYEELLAREDIDAVYIATTHNFHYENLLLTLNAGKHVICEKPMVLTKREAEEVFALAREKGCFCMEAMWSRFLPPVQKAREWIAAGKIGEVEMANCSIGFCSNPDPENRIRNPKLAGGALYDIGVYALEITDYLVPEQLKSVSSAITRTPQGVDKVDCLTLQYENCVACLQTTVTSGVSSALHIYGTKGRIFLPDPISCSLCELHDEKGLRESFFSRCDNGFVYEIQHMVDSIRSGALTSDVIPPEDTIGCAAIFDQCLGTR